MSNDKFRMAMDGDSWKRSGMSALVTAALTAGSLIGYFQVNPPRADPFTGSEGNELRLEIERKLGEMEYRLANQLDQLKASNDQALINQQEMWRTIAKLPPEQWQRRIKALEIWVIKQDPSFNPPQ